MKKIYTETEFEPIECSPIEDIFDTEEDIYEHLVESLLFEAGIVEAVKRLLSSGKFVTTEEIAIILGVKKEEEKEEEEV